MNRWSAISYSIDTLTGSKFVVINNQKVAVTFTRIALSIDDVNVHV